MFQNNATWGERHLQLSSFTLLVYKHRLPVWKNCRNDRLQNERRFLKWKLLTTVHSETTTE